MMEKLGRMIEERRSGCQFSLTTGKSVEDAWLRVRNFTKESSSKYVLGVFIDFKGGFR